MIDNQHILEHLCHILRGKVDFAKESANHK